MKLDWELVLRALPLIVGAIVSLYKLRDLNPRLRATLKTDAEILERLDPNSAAYKSLKQSIEARVERLSADPQNEVILFDVVLGVLFIVGFGFWTAYIVRDGFSLWALLTGYLTLSGAGFVLLGFRGRPKDAPPPATAADPTPTS
jgi:hypothetical protein